MTKVIIINGSPRANGNSDAIVNVAKEELEAKGAEVDIFQIRDKDIHFCVGCNTCKKTGKCVFDDDATELITKIDEYDNLLFVSPIYFAYVTSISKTFIDRTYAKFDPSKVISPSHEKHADEDKKVGIVLTNGTMTIPQVMPIAGQIAQALNVLGFTDNKNVVCGGNLAPDAFLENEDQEEQVKNLAGWLSE